MDRTIHRFPLSRRDFLKKGMFTGVLAASFPLWKHALAGCTGSQIEEESLLVGTPFFLSEPDLSKLLQSALGRGGEFAELYMEYSISNTISLDEEKIALAIRGIDMGIGFRVLHGEKTGYAFSSDLEFARLNEAAKTAALIASGPTLKNSVELETRGLPSSFYLVNVPPDTVAAKDKAGLLLRINEVARAFNKNITEVQARFSDTTKKIVIVNSEGLHVEDTQTLSQLVAYMNARSGSKRSTGLESKSGSFGFEHFDLKTAETLAQKAADMAIRTLPAEDAPAGEFPVVIARGFGGIFFHEAIGHSLEADGIRKKTSCFWDKLGEPIASNNVTLVDDGTYKGGWGSVNVDDEGHPGRKTVLIDRGKCAAFLQDNLNAGLMNMSPTGNGRRESYHNYSIPRMTNTYMLAGESAPEDIIKSVDRGLYIARIGGGNVTPTTGKFVFSVSEGYMIEGGKITHPLKGIMLMGSGQEVLKNITLVGNDLEVIGGGRCGKGGQTKPVGFGNPTLKVAKITVGGRKA